MMQPDHDRHNVSWPRGAHRVWHLGRVDIRWLRNAGHARMVPVTSVADLLALLRRRHPLGVTRADLPLELPLPLQLRQLVLHQHRNLSSCRRSRADGACRQGVTAGARRVEA